MMTGVLPPIPASARRPAWARALLIASACLLAFPRMATAQDNTAEMLTEAVRHYEDLQVERALGVLRRIISPSSPFEVSREQRVQAYTYLGASLALLGRRDSAIVYFRAALERDPFVDLDPQRFTSQERNAFAEAQQRSFGVAIRPVSTARIKPGAGQLGFVYMVTHEASFRLELRPPGATERATLEQREGRGLNELSWSGILPDGTLTPAGVHELAIVADSRLTGKRDSARVFFTVRHDYPVLEDTLPPLGLESLLPERHPSSEPSRELLRGLGIAVAAVLAPVAIGNGELGSGGRTLSMAVAGGAGIAGVVAFVARRRNDQIPANVAENRRRVAEHAARNAEITARNAARLAETTLVVTPGLGTAQ